jgi:hypothetical protein
MTDRLDTLARQRADLSAEIAQQRTGLAHAAQRLHRPLQRIDRAREDFQFFRERYVYLLLPVALLAVLNPGRSLRLLLGAWTLWRTFDRAGGTREDRVAQTLAAYAARRL